MKLKEQNVLFFTRNMGLGGTENVVLQMCETLKPLVNKIVVCSSGGVHTVYLKEMGIKHYNIPDISEKSIYNTLTILKTVHKIIKLENITIVHTHHRMAAFYTYMLNIFINFKFLASVHGEFYDKRLFTKIAYSKAHIIACGEMVKKNLTDYFGIKKKILVLRNAVAKDVSPLVEISSLTMYRKDNYKLVGYIGRLSEEKGVLYLVDSLPYYAENEKVLYVIVGEGPLKEDMDRKLEANGCKNKVLYLGYRNDPQNIIRQLDCVVLPSLTEGLPLAPIESFAQGKPVVASAVGGTVEIVKEGKNGLLISPKLSSKIAEAIKKMLFDEKFYESCSKNARNDYDSKFSMNVFNSKLQKIYSDITG